MPAGVRPKQCVGKKGASGRKSAYEEHNKTQAINTLWKKVNAKVQAGEELTEYEEKLVLSILPKTIKTDSKMELELPNAVLVKFLSDEQTTDNNRDTE